MILIIILLLLGIVTAIFCVCVCIFKEYRRRLIGAIGTLLLLIGGLFSATVMMPPFEPTGVSSELLTIRPNAVGDLGQWQDYPAATYNWQKVDEAGGGDGDSTYVRTSLYDQNYYRDLYNAEDPSPTAGYQPVNVTIYGRTRSSDPYEGAFYITIKTNGVTYTYYKDSPPTSYTLYSHFLDLNPQTSLEWTINEINALQIGVYGKSGVDNPKNPTAWYPIRCTQVYAIVGFDYVPPITLTNGAHSGSVADDIGLQADCTTTSGTLDMYALWDNSTGTYERKTWIDFLGTPTSTVITINKTYGSGDFDLKWSIEANNTDGDSTFVLLGNDTFTMAAPVETESVNIRPTADASPEEWSSSTGTGVIHFEDLDEAGDGDEDTTRVWVAGTVDPWKTDHFTMEDVSLSSSTITKIKVYGRARSELHANKGSFRLEFDVDGTIHASATWTPSTEYTLYVFSLTENSNDDFAFEDLDIDRIEAGIKGQSGRDPLATGAIYCTQLWIEVVYTTPPARNLLWVDDYNSTDTSWAPTGNSPYIDDSYDSNIKSVAANYNISWFTFDDTTYDPSHSWLEFEARKKNHDDGGTIRMHLWDGYTMYDLGTMEVDLNYKWYRRSISGIVDTPTKACMTMIKIESEEAGLYTVVIRRARLHLWIAYPSEARITSPVYPSSNEEVTVSWKWHHAVGVDMIYFSENSSGSWAANQTLDVSGTPNWGNFTFTMPDSYETVMYKYWILDESATWAWTNEEPLYGFWGFNLENYDLGANSTVQTSMRHSYGRKAFQIGGNYILFYANGSRTRAEFHDGNSWNYVQDVCDATAGYFIYFWVNNISDVYYIHYIRCDESLGDDVFYRRGTINTGTGEISWSAAVQTVQALSGSSMGYVTSVVVDSNNYPYIMWANRTSGYQIYMTKSENNDGTWSTESGFPRQLNSISALVSGQLLPLPDESIQAVWCMAGGYPAKARIWNDTASSLSGIVSASTANVQNNYYFSVINDPSGHVNLVFSNTVSLLHSWKNYTTGTWEIKDQLVSANVDEDSFPAIGWDSIDSKVYCNWITQLDDSAWVNTYNSSELWEQEQRLYTIIPSDGSARWSSDPNIVIPYATLGEILYITTQDEAPTQRIHTYFYVTSLTELVVGENVINPLARDVGRTLAEINVSIWLDGIQMYSIVYINATGHYPFYYQYEFNKNVIVTDMSHTLKIWCNTAGSWYHSYG